MALQASFDILSRVIERYETGERTVRHVEVTTDEDGDGLRVSMELPVSLCAASDERVQSALTPETATLTTGGIQVEFSTSPLASLPQAAAAAVSASEAAVRVVDDSVMLSVELTIDPSATDHQLQRSTDRSERSPATASAQEVAEFGDNSSTGTVATDADSDCEDARASDSEADERADVDRLDDGSGAVATGDERAAELAAVRDESVPPYDDTAYLARLYERCETFTEMSQVIDMDVSSETVRRYMIEADVHCPASYEVDSGTDADEASQRDASDDVARSDASDEASQRDASDDVARSDASDDVAPSDASDDVAPSDASDGLAPSEDTTQADRDGASADGESTAATEPDQHPSSAETEIQSPSETDESLPEVRNEQLVTDGSGLPADVELQEVADAVVDSVTVYEVQRRLELDRAQTVDLLKRLNLIDFATGRVSDQPEQSVSYEQVAARIRETAPGGA